MKLKKGDIVLNRWAGMVEGRYFIFTGKSNGMVNGIVFGSGKLAKVQYYSNSLDELFIDGEPSFKVVGRTSAYDVMKEDLRKFHNLEETE